MLARTAPTRALCRWCVREEAGEVPLTHKTNPITRDFKRNAVLCCLVNSALPFQSFILKPQVIRTKREEELLDEPSTFTKIKILGKQIHETTPNRPLNCSQ